MCTCLECGDSRGILLYFYKPTNWYTVTVFPCPGIPKCLDAESPVQAQVSRGSNSNEREEARQRVGLTWPT